MLLPHTTIKFGDSFDSWLSESGGFFTRQKLDCGHWCIGTVQFGRRDGDGPGISIKAEGVHLSGVFTV